MKANASWKVLVIAGACWPVAAFAYIDPGTGSILIQGLIAAIAAVGVTLKLYWHRFVGMFRRKANDDSGSRHAQRGNRSPRQEELRP